MKATRPEIPWATVRGIGNVLRHEYHRVVDNVVWAVVVKDLPPLRVAIKAMAGVHGRGELMALTRSYKDTVKARAKRDQAFRDALLTEALDTAIARGIADADAGRSNQPTKSASD